MIDMAEHVCRLETTQVVDSRTTAGGTIIRRRRECACGVRFTTYETIETVTLTPARHRQWLAALDALDTARVLLLRLESPEAELAPESPSV